MNGGDVGFPVVGQVRLLARLHDHDSANHMAHHAQWPECCLHPRAAKLRSSPMVPGWTAKFSPTMSVACSAGSPFRPQAGFRPAWEVEERSLHLLPGLPRPGLLRNPVLILRRVLGQVEEHSGTRQSEHLASTNGETIFQHAPAPRCWRVSSRTA